MSFIKYIFSTNSWISSRETKPVYETKRRLNAYNHGMNMGATSDLPTEAISHVRELEKKKVSYERLSNANPVYDQKQVDFWRNHTHELYNMVVHRSTAFCGSSSHNDSGLAINFLAA
ncbi:MAG: hypothetical protein ACRCVN_01565 [Spirochaetia bacterium]